jgi:hypothetical protein
LTTFAQRCPSRRSRLADTGNPQHGSILAQQVGELSDIRRDPPCLNFAEQLGRFLLPYIIIINVSKRLPLAVLDDVASEVIFKSMARGNGGSSPSHQPPYDQDDYDQNSNLINVTHGVATFSSPTNQQ